MSLIQPVLQPASSGQGDLIKESFLIDVFTFQDVSFVQPLLQPVSSDPGALITAGVLFDVSTPALSPGGGG